LAFLLLPIPAFGLWGCSRPKHDQASAPPELAAAPPAPGLTDVPVLADSGANTLVCNVQRKKADGTAEPYTYVVTFDQSNQTITLTEPSDPSKVVQVKNDSSPPMPSTVNITSEIISWSLSSAGTVIDRHTGNFLSRGVWDEVGKCQPDENPRSLTPPN
jgi:hypothetical protein